jgi:hypothetical protein
VPSKVALVGKPDGQRNLGQWQLRFMEHLFDLLEASLEQVCVRRCSNRLSESTCEMMRGKSCQGSETVEGYLLIEMRLHVCAYAVFERR